MKGHDKQKTDDGRVTKRKMYSLAAEIGQNSVTAIFWTTSIAQNG